MKFHTLANQKVYYYIRGKIRQLKAKFHEKPVGLKVTTETWKLLRLLGKECYVENSNTERESTGVIGTLANLPITIIPEGNFFYSGNHSISFSTEKIKKIFAEK